MALGNADGEISGLTISDPPTQGEVQALRDKAEELADDVRSLSTLIHSLRTALVVEGLPLVQRSRPLLIRKMPQHLSAPGRDVSITVLLRLAGRQFLVRLEKDDQCIVCVNGNPLVAHDRAQVCIFIRRIQGSRTRCPARRCQIQPEGRPQRTDHPRHVASNDIKPQDKLAVVLGIRGELQRRERRRISWIRGAPTVLRHLAIAINAKKRDEGTFLDSWSGNELPGVEVISVWGTYDRDHGRGVQDVINADHSWARHEAAAAVGHKLQEQQGPVN